MQLDKGELYFVRELDFQTKKHTNFVKIGLVRDKEGRSSIDRLSEHQTGNPRRLELPEGNVIFTDAINRVEAQMHNVFAKHRVSGEWFEFASEAEIAGAKKVAADLAAQVASYSHIFLKADELDKVPASEESKSSTPEIDKSASTMQIAKSELKVLAELEAEIAGLFTQAVESGKDTKGAAKTTSRVYQGKFDKAKFESENSELFAKYLVETKKWNHSFLFKLKTLSLEFLPQDFQDFVTEVHAELAGTKESGNVEDLNEISLAISHKKALAEWDAELATAELKTACDKFEEIAGICTWKRFESSTFSFDEAALKVDEPELYALYVGEGTEKTYVRPAKVKLK